MSTLNNTRVKTLSRRDVVDLVRAALILGMTVAAALIVPPKVFGATTTPTSIEQQTIVR